MTTATWASLFPPPPSAHFGSPAPSATGEGRSDREGVRDIERDARSEINCTRTGTPSAHANAVAKYDEAPVPRGTSHRWEVLMAADERAELPRRERRTALDVRREHRVLHDLGADVLRRIPLLPDGARLSRRGEYLDLHDPARADFRALGDEIVRPGQRMVARSEVSAEAWQALLDACDRVLGRRSLPRSA